MEKRKLMLDSLDAAFASKKPKIQASQNVLRNKPGINHQKTAKAAKKDMEKNVRGLIKAATQQKVEMINPLYTQLNDQCLSIARPIQATKAIHKIKVLEESLAAMALGTRLNNEQLLEAIKNKVLQLGNSLSKKIKKKIQSNGLETEFPHEMSMKTRRKRDLHTASNSIEYKDAEEIHQFWLMYVDEMIDEISNGDASSAPSFQPCMYSAKLFRADLRGCKLKVIKSKNLMLIGANGIILDEHANTFDVITSSGKIQRFPKSGSTFSFNTTARSFRIEGSRFISRKY